MNRDEFLSLTSGDVVDFVSDPFIKLVLIHKVR